MRIVPLLILLLLLSTYSVVAEEQGIVNSRDWRDVYSSMLYGELSGLNVRFLTSTNHAKLILNAIPKDDDINVFSSQSNPYVANYEVLIKAEEFSSTKETVSNTLNLALAQQLPNINKYIIIDDSYGYNAIAAAPYASVDNYYVLFADAGNIDAVDQFLSGKNPASVILFGQLDAQVKDILAKYNPEIINEGDRFENNMAIVDKYLKVKPTKQVILTNGEFIEQSLMTGDDPVLFIGKANVPEKIRTYITNSDFEVAILIGNELIATATFIRRQIGISVFVKFAQGARSPEGPISEVEDLDRFPMPSYVLGMSIDSAVYNSATNTLEVTYKNDFDLATFFTSTIIVLPDNLTLQDNEAVFLDGAEYKTVPYNQLRDGGTLSINSLEAEAQIITFYGESPEALENQLTATVPISRVTVDDSSLIEISDVVYSPSAQRFFVTVKNIGPVKAYVHPEIVDVLVNDEPTTRASEDVLLIPEGESAQFPIKLKMTEADILDNREVTARAYYGVRENALVKIVLATFPMRLVGADYTVYIIFAVVLLLLIILLFVKKECNVCKEKNPVHRSKCKRCKAPFRKK